MKPDVNRFDSQQYLDDYYNRGKFPKIHNLVGDLILNYASEPEPCCDIGGCIGIMAARAVIQGGRTHCHVFEGYAGHLERAVKHDRITYHPMYVTHETIPQIEEIVRENGVTLCIARRCFSEVGNKDVTVVDRLAEAMHRAGVKKMIIQGRVPVPNPAMLLPTTESEYERLCPWYDFRGKNGPAWYLRRVPDGEVAARLEKREKTA